MCLIDIAKGYDACEGKKKKCMNHFLTQIGDKRFIQHDGETKVIFDCSIEILLVSPEQICLYVLTCNIL
jgi:hypothetical protein